METNPLLMGLGYVVTVVLAVLGGCVVVTFAWTGAMAFGKQWDEYRRKRNEREAEAALLGKGFPE